LAIGAKLSKSPRRCGAPFPSAVTSRAQACSGASQDRKFLLNLIRCVAPSQHRQTPRSGEPMRLKPLFYGTVLLSVMPFVAVSGVLVGVLRAPKQDGSPNTFIIPSDDGYGLADCLADGSPCGKIVADAWCRAHGYEHARRFRQSNGPSLAMASESAPVASLVECRN
jgi:hypothetical protein